jgi:hypothetical protein
VWRSVWSHGDTKTEKSRRTLALPEMAVNALRAHREQQAGDRGAADLNWSDRDLVFSTRTGAPLDAANVRRVAASGDHHRPPTARAASARASVPLA